MNLDDLRYFLAIAETGLLHRAAAQTGVSQPALTKAVRRLEAQVGVPLFERHAKGMRLTRYGEIFVRGAATMQLRYRETLDLIGELHSGELATVRVGTTPAAEPLVARTFVALQRARPALRIEMKIRLSDALFHALASSEVDAAVAPVPADVPAGLVVRPLSEDHVWIACRKGHRILRESKPLSAHSLARAAWVLPGQSVPVRQQIEALYRQLGLDAPSVQVESEYGSASGVFFILANTDLLGICNSQQRSIAERLGLRMVDVENAHWRRTIGLFTRQSGELSPLTETFVDHLRREALAVGNDG
ncbi:LysR family transcriptional regulator [Pandoraea sp.]|uniref:LysR family transcriptional regulator n=1 Tax=Pandoraea sp. TaxID=1883445 RepID=UPI0025CCBC69|nr:LysR family transcriptional regulator [Pandoraea sp.]